MDKSSVRSIRDGEAASVAERLRSSLRLLVQAGVGVGTFGVVEGDVSALTEFLTPVKPQSVVGHNKMFDRYLGIYPLCQGQARV